MDDLKAREKAAAQPPPQQPPPMNGRVICAETGETIAPSSKIESLRIRIVVSMAPGPERPDAAKGDQRSPDAMD